ncbi:unnamed protein product [Echinostoma caproni]|uniref:Claudin n=1 Tax=Echinostoma caproni TaxID=27848 RepID=A0A183BAN9_9TREM|nr:unnamed protein product [Echinostoma caproni]
MRIHTNLLNRSVSMSGKKNDMETVRPVSVPSYRLAAMRTGICVTGFIGTYFCLQQRISRTNPQVTLVIRRLAGTLSLVSCILCLVASIFSGQKGSLIATYGTECVPSNPRLATVTVSNDTDPQSTEDPQSGFEQQCCVDGADRVLGPLCQCFNVRNQLMWSYRGITCRYLFSSVKDYLILQSALMAVGTGVCLWFWVVLIEQFQPVPDVGSSSCSELQTAKKYSLSSVKNSIGETTTTSYDGKRFSSETPSDSKPRGPNHAPTIVVDSTGQPSTTYTTILSSPLTKTIPVTCCTESVIRDSKLNRSTRCVTGSRLLDSPSESEMSRHSRQSFSQQSAPVPNGLQIKPVPAITKDASGWTQSGSTFDRRGSDSSRIPCEIQK